ARAGARAGGGGDGRGRGRAHRLHGGAAPAGGDPRAAGGGRVRAGRPGMGGAGDDAEREHGGESPPRLAGRRAAGGGGGPVGVRPAGWLIGAGLALYAALASDPLFPAPRRLGCRGVEEREPGLETAALAGGYVYPDGQVAFPERLCVELAREAGEVGATLRNH